MLDRAKQMFMLENDRPHVLREMIYVCKPGGILSIPGVYLGLADKIPLGQLMNKGLTVRTGQTHVNRWTDDLLQRIEEGQIDPSFVITHTVPLEAGAADVQGVPRQAGQLHQGCAEALKLMKGPPPMNAMLSAISSRAKGDPKILGTGPSSLGPDDRLARNLGWFRSGLARRNCSRPA